MNQLNEELARAHMVARLELAKREQRAYRAVACRRAARRAEEAVMRASRLLGIVG